VLPQRRRNKRHRVLQLVAEAECAARLVEPGPAPHSAPKRLVDQPAIEHQIQSSVGRADLDGAEGAIPCRPDLFQRAVCPPGITVELREPPRVFIGLRLSEHKDDDVLATRRQLELGHQRSAGVAQVTGPVGEPLPPEGGGRFRRPVAAQELGAVGRERAGTTRHVGESDATGEITRPGGAGEQGAALRVERAQHIQCGLLAEHAQHPLHVESC